MGGGGGGQKLMRVEGWCWRTVHARCKRVFVTTSASRIKQQQQQAAAASKQASKQQQQQASKQQQRVPRVHASHIHPSDVGIACDARGCVRGALCCSGSQLNRVSVSFPPRRQHIPHVVACVHFSQYTPATHSFRRKRRSCQVQHRVLAEMQVKASLPPPPPPLPLLLLLPQLLPLLLPPPL